MKIRDAHLHDVEWLLSACCVFAAEHNMRFWFPDPDTGRRLLREWIGGQFVIVAHEGNARAGFLLAFGGPMRFNPDVYALNEALWWVHPDHRKGRAGLMLLDAFTKFAKTNSDYATFSLVGPTGDDALARRGFHYGERVLEWRRA